MIMKHRQVILPFVFYIWVFHNDDCDSCGVLGFVVVRFGMNLLMFQRNALPLSSRQEVKLQHIPVDIIFITHLKSSVYSWIISMCRNFLWTTTAYVALSQATPCVLWMVYVRYRFHKSRPLVSARRQFNVAHEVIECCPNIFLCFIQLSVCVVLIGP